MEIIPLSLIYRNLFKSSRAIPCISFLKPGKFFFNHITKGYQLPSHMVAHAHTSQLKMHGFKKQIIVQFCLKQPYVVQRQQQSQDEKYQNQVLTYTHNGCSKILTVKCGPYLCSSKCMCACEHVKALLYTRKPFQKVLFIHLLLILIEFTQLSSFTDNIYSDTCCNRLWV